MSELRRARKTTKVKNGEIEHGMDRKKKSSYHQIGKIGGKKIEEVTGCMIKFDEINDKFDMRMENFEF